MFANSGFAATRLRTGSVEAPMQGAPGVDKLQKGWLPNLTAKAGSAPGSLLPWLFMLRQEFGS